MPVRKAPKREPSLPLDLARRGWRPHRFHESNIVVFLPEEVVAAFDPEGVLHGSTNGNDIEFSATLHGGFEKKRASALDFVAHLARKNRRNLREAGTYRYYFDPTKADITANALRFWVIGIPGAVVVVSIMCQGKIPVSKPLRDVRREIPHIVGEVM